MIKINKLLKNKYELYLELALTINKNMYNDKTITYQTYKQTEDNLLEKIKNNNVKDVAKLPQ